MFDYYGYLPQKKVGYFPRVYNVFRLLFSFYCIFLQLFLGIYIRGHSTHPRGTPSNENVSCCRGLQWRRTTRSGDHQPTAREYP